MARGQGLRYTGRGVRTRRAPAQEPDLSADTDTRPHHRIWPKRLPRTLEIPRTSLWFNLEVAATRLPARAGYGFFGPRITFAEVRA